MPAEPILLIPDVHQDADFLLRCITAGQPHQPGEILFLGDLLDHKSRKGKTLPAIRQTLRIVDALIHDSDIPTTLLWGNHDWKYWAAREELAERAKELNRNVEYFLNSDLSVLTVDVLQEADEKTGRVPFDLFERAILAVERNGWLISHAGVHASLWPEGTDVTEGVQQLNHQMKTLSDEPSSDPRSALLGAGPCRGGFHPVGGPLWQDFFEEFEDDLPCPQIVGHTRCAEPAQKGRSYCLDACQSVCALLEPGGSLEILDVH